jgi:hypothetical protein
LKNRFALFVALACSLGTSPTLAATKPAARSAPVESTSKYRVGVDLGIGVPTSDTYGNARVVLGADFYLVHSAELDFGASYLTGGKRLDNGHRWRTNFVGGEANLKLPHVSPGFYVGASAGVVSFDGGDAFLPGVDDLYFGPKIGLERMIARDFSFGVESKLIFVTSSSFLTWLDLLGAFRFHF